MAITAEQYELTTGQAAPANFEAVEGRVVARLSELLNTDLGDLDPLPITLQDAIAWGVHTLTTPSTASLLAPGVTSLDIAGEYKVTVADGTVFGADGQTLPARWAFASDLGGRCLSLALRHRHIPLGF